jgi:hypothetical protein
LDTNKKITERLEHAGFFRKVECCGTSTTPKAPLNTKREMPGVARIRNQQHNTEHGPKN